jgi:hypothetical protein
MRASKQTHESSRARMALITCSVLFCLLFSAVPQFAEERSLGAWQQAPSIILQLRSSIEWSGREAPNHRVIGSIVSVPLIPDGPFFDLTDSNSFLGADLQPYSYQGQEGSKHTTERAKSCDGMVGKKGNDSIGHEYVVWAVMLIMGVGFSAVSLIIAFLPQNVKWATGRDPRLGFLKIKRASRQEARS